MKKYSVGEKKAKVQYRAYIGISEDSAYLQRDNRWKNKKRVDERNNQTKV